MKNTYLKSRLILLIRILMLILVISIGIFLTFSDKKFDTRYSKIKNFNSIEGIELFSGDILEQEIKFLDDHFEYLGVSLLNRTHNYNGEITVSILKDDITVFENEIDISDCKLKRNLYIKTDMLVDIDAKYYVRISANQQKGKIMLGGVLTEYNTNEIETCAEKNGEKLEKSLASAFVYKVPLNTKARILILLWTSILAIGVLTFEKLISTKGRVIASLFLLIDTIILSIYYRFGLNFQNRINYFIFAGIVFSAVFVFGIFCFLYKRKCNKVEIYFLVSAFVFGMLFSVCLPPFSAPDEDFHFEVSYRLSNAFMGQKINDENGYIYMRECDIRNYEWYPDNSYQTELIKELKNFKNDEKQKIIASESNRNSYVPIFMYIPQSIGITIGRILNLNYSWLVFLGRWVNLVTFIIITYFAIKWLPYGKWIIFSIAHIPLLLELVSSYSYDILILSGSFLLVSYILKLRTQENMISNKQLIGLICLLCIYVPLKPVYAPLAGLVLLIPDSKISDTKRISIVKKAVLLILSLVVVLLVYKCSFMTMKWIESEKQILTNSDSDEYVKRELDYYNMIDIDPVNKPNSHYLLDNPMHMVESFMNAYLSFTDEYIFSTFGNYLGWYHIRVPLYVSLLSMLMLMIACKLGERTHDNDLNRYEKVLTIVLMIGCCFAVFLSMYLKNTMPSVRSIIGVQGRYLLPLLSVLPCFFMKQEPKLDDQQLNILMLAVMIQTVALVSVCRVIWA